MENYADNQVRLKILCPFSPGLEPEKPCKHIKA